MGAGVGRVCHACHPYECRHIMPPREPGVESSLALTHKPTATRQRPDTATNHYTASYSHRLAFRCSGSGRSMDLTLSVASPSCLCSPRRPAVHPLPGVPKMALFFAHDSPRVADAPLNLASLLKLAACFEFRQAPALTCASFSALRLGNGAGRLGISLSIGRRHPGLRLRRASCSCPGTASPAGVPTLPAGGQLPHGL